MPIPSFHSRFFHYSLLLAWMITILVMVFQSSTIFFDIRFFAYTNVSIMDHYQSQGKQLQIRSSWVRTPFIEGMFLGLSSQAGPIHGRGQWGCCGESLWPQVHLSDGNLVPLPIQETVLLVQHGYIHVPLGGHGTVATEFACFFPLGRHLYVRRHFCQ